MYSKSFVLLIVIAFMGCDKAPMPLFTSFNGYDTPIALEMQTFSNHLAEMGGYALMGTDLGPFFERERKLYLTDNDGNVLVQETLDSISFAEPIFLIKNNKVFTAKVTPFRDDEVTQLSLSENGFEKTSLRGMMDSLKSLNGLNAPFESTNSWFIHKDKLIIMTQTSPGLERLLYSIYIGDNDNLVYEYSSVYKLNFLDISPTLITYPRYELAFKYHDNHAYLSIVENDVVFLPPPSPPLTVNKRATIVRFDLTSNNNNAVFDLSNTIENYWQLKWDDGIASATMGDNHLLSNFYGFEVVDEDHVVFLTTAADTSTPGWLPYDEDYYYFATMSLDAVQEKTAQDLNFKQIGSADQFAYNLWPSLHRTNDDAFFFSAITPDGFRYFDKRSIIGNTISDNEWLSSDISSSSSFSPVDSIHVEPTFDGPPKIVRRHNDDGYNVLDSYRFASGRRMIMLELDNDGYIMER